MQLELGLTNPNPIIVPRCVLNVTKPWAVSAVILARCRISALLRLKWDLKMVGSKKCKRNHNCTTLGTWSSPVFCALYYTSLLLSSSTSQKLPPENSNLLRIYCIHAWAFHPPEVRVMLGYLICKILHPLQRPGGVLKRVCLTKKHPLSWIVLIFETVLMISGRHYLNAHSISS